MCHLCTVRHHCDLKKQVYGVNYKEKISLQKLRGPKRLKILLQVELDISLNQT